MDLRETLMPRILTPQSEYEWDELNLAIALGNVPQHTSFRKFGMNPDVGTGAKEQMWPPGTIKTLPTTAAVASVVSSSTADDADPAGTGAWTVTVEGLDENFLEVSETVSLNGTSAVTTTQTFIRLFRAYCVTAGTGGINAGNISISVGGNLQSYIEADEGRSHQTDYCVPADKILILNYYMVRVGRMAGTSDAHITGEIRLGAGENDESWQAISDIWLYNGAVHSNDSSRTVLPPKTDLRQRINTSATTQAVGIYGGWLIELGAY